jgi:hypothetical protein
MTAYRIWKPRQAIWEILGWDLMAIAPGIFTLVWFWQYPWLIAAGVVMCLFGFWQFLCSLCVTRTHFITTEHEVISVGYSGSISLPWDKVFKVTIRERPGLLQAGRPDRMVVLADNREIRLVLNTSVLDEKDEALLLQEIRQRLTCPITILHDGASFLRRF